VEVNTSRSYHNINNDQIKHNHQYLMKITQIHDQLAKIGEKVEDAKLVNMALNGFPAS
jgi:hypothetical protein